MRLILRLALIAVVLMGSIAARADEFRGIFADAFNPGFKNHEEVVRMVGAVKEANLNALFVQVRARGDVFYDSSIEPKSADIAPDYDALKDVISEGHAAGLKVYAWVNTYRVAKSAYDPLTPDHPRAKHIEWLMSDIDGDTIFGEEMSLDPGVPAVQDYITSIVREIAARYDVDGIHLDALAYPSYLGGYNPTSVELYNRSVGKSGTPLGPTQAWCDWRANQITNLVKRIKTEVSAVKPGVTLSANVLNFEPMVAKMTWLQEWDKWMREKHLDFVVPLLYHEKEEVFGKAVGRVLSASPGRHAYIGVGAWRVSAEEAGSRIEACRDAKCPGIVLNSYYKLSLKPDPDCATLTDLSAQVFAEPASAPIMPWRK